MFWNKFKNTAIVLLLAVFTVIGGGFAFRALAGDEQPSQPETRKEAGVKKDQAKAQPTADKSPLETVKEPWGVTTQGLQMSLSATRDSKAGIPEFQVSFRNVGEQDVHLNLGIMLGNGKVQLPDKIHLFLTDAQGKTQDLHFADKRYLGIAGRVDDYVVPLRVGSVYTLKLPLSQFWSPTTEEFALHLKEGKYQVSAQLEGVGAKHSNLDLRMHFWEGKLQSNVLKLEQKSPAETGTK
jgi:hypothetical protein